MFYVVLQPSQLLGAQRTQSASLQVHHVHEANEVHAFSVEAVPASALCVSSETREILFSIVTDDVVLAGNVKNLLGPGASQNLLHVVELFGSRQVADVAGVQQELWRRRERIDLVHRSLQRARYVRIRRLVESHVAIADLREAQLAFHLRGIKLRNSAQAIG